MNHASSMNPASGRPPDEDVDLRGVKAVLLVGGMGTRLRSVVSSAPKPLATVGDRPFLELLIRQLQNQGIREIIMCSGYMADQIEKEFGDGRKSGLSIEYSKEMSPLGTAGALKFAKAHLENVSDFFVLNGDSFFEMDFRRFIQFHRASRGLACMAVLKMKNDKRYGTVKVDASGRVTGFAEKIHSDPSGFVNAGIYAFNRAIFDHIPDGPASLERDVFPHVLSSGIFAFEQDGVFIDIGTPEDYARAQVIWERLNDAATTGQSVSSGDPEKN